MEGVKLMLDTACMAREPRPSPKVARSPTMIRAWRKWKGWSLEQVVERLEIDAEFPYSVGQLSRVERGDYPYNQDLLEALGFVFKASIPDLLSRDPSVDPDQEKEELDPEILETAMRLVSLARAAGKAG